MTVKLIDHNRDNDREFETRKQAEEKKNDMVSLGASPEDLEIVANGVADDIDADIVSHSEEADKSESEDTQPPNVIDTQEAVAQAEETTEALDELGESLETDPLSILPGHMVDNIQGQPAINKRGYAMIAERYGVSVKSYIECLPWENEEGRCVARAVATTDDGKEYQDYATASKEDGDMPEQLVELASTRALKRVTGWATGLGIVSYQELSNQLERDL